MPFLKFFTLLTCYFIKYQRSNFQRKNCSVVPLNLKQCFILLYHSAQEIDHFNSIVMTTRIRFYLFKQNFCCINVFRERTHFSTSLKLGRKAFYPREWWKALEHLSGVLGEDFKGAIGLYLFQHLARQTDTLTIICKVTSLPFLFELEGRAGKVLNVRV